MDHRRLGTRGKDDGARPIRPFHHVPTKQLSAALSSFPGAQEIVTVLAQMALAHR